MDLIASPNADAASSSFDPYTIEHLVDPKEFHSLLQDLGPLVWLSRYGVWATGTHAVVTAIFRNHKTFCSSRGVGLEDFSTGEPWRPPSLILEADPPQHTRTRRVLSSVLSVQALANLRESFKRVAEDLVEELLDQGQCDGIDDLAAAFPLKVFPNAVGLNTTDNHNLLQYGNLVFNMLGPQNVVANKARANASTVLPWIAQQCERANLQPTGLGQEVYKFADAGEITNDEASLLVRSLLSAGLDTTVFGLGNALYCFANHPEQWSLLHDDPNRAKFAFDEVLRYQSPVHTFYRTAVQDTVVANTQIRAGDKVLLNIDCANRDPARWPDPNKFDILRKPGGHAAFGVGIHACVGRHLATLEAEILLQALASRVTSIRLADEPERVPNNALRGFSKLPITLS